jgi:hypothetical protein
MSVEFLLKRLIYIAPMNNLQVLMRGSVECSCRGGGSTGSVSESEISVFENNFSCVSPVSECQFIKLKPFEESE